MNFDPDDPSGDGSFFLQGVLHDDPRRTFVAGSLNPHHDRILRGMSIIRRDRCHTDEKQPGRGRPNGELSLHLMGDLEGFLIDVVHGEKRSIPKRPCQSIRVQGDKEEVENIYLRRCS
jgi:hypothetical protein